MDKLLKHRTIDNMTPYEIAAGSLFMAKEAGLQKILQSLGDATGADPTRLQDSLVGLLGGGAVGAGAGALAGGGKGAILGGSLGGVGGAAAGYHGSDFVRSMLEKLLSKDEGHEGPKFGDAQQLEDEHQMEQTIGMTPKIEGSDINLPAPDMSGMSPMSMTDYSQPGFDPFNPAPQFNNMDGSIQRPGNGVSGDFSLSAPSVDLKALQALAAGGQ